MPDDRTELVRDHPVHDGLDEVLGEITHIRAEPGLSRASQARLRRAHTVVDHIRTALRVTAADLVPVTILDQMKTSLDKASTANESFIADVTQEELLHEADGHLDVVLMNARFLPAPPFRIQEQAVIEAAERYREHLVELENSVRDEFSSLGSQMDAKSEAFRTEAQAATGRLSDLKSAEDAALEEVQSHAQQLSQEITNQTETRISSLQNDLETLQGRIDGMVDTQQKNFLDSEAQRSQAFNEAQTKFLTGAQAATATLTDEFRTRKTDLEGQAAAVVASLNDKDDQASRVLGQTAASAVAGAYIHEADEQRHEANVWRLVALSVGVLVLIAAAIDQAISPIVNSSLSETLRHGLARLPFGAVPALIASFAIREAGRHRDREQAARRRALELTAFRPFLAELTTAERNAAIASAAGRFFSGDGGGDAESVSKDTTRPVI